MNVVLNRIDDVAANELLTFYQSLIAKGVSGSGKYEAHFSVALLLWRNHGEDKMEEIIGHFRLAAEEAVKIFEARPVRHDRTSEDIFSFMFPMFVTYTYGTTPIRERLSLIVRNQWAPVKDDEYESLIKLFELLCTGAVTRKFHPGELRQILAINENYITHPFYQPWIEAMCLGLLAIHDGNLGTLEENIDKLVELHADEAYDGSYSHLVEGLIAFWPLAVKTTAQYQGIKLETVSEYIP